MYTNLNNNYETKIILLVIVEYDLLLVDRNIEIYLPTFQSNCDFLLHCRLPFVTSSVYIEPANTMHVPAVGALPHITRFASLIHSPPVTIDKAIVIFTPNEVQEFYKAYCIIPRIKRCLTSQISVYNPTVSAP